MAQRGSYARERYAFAHHPISGIVMSRMEPQYIARVWRYLEHLGCTVKYLRDQNQYHIVFPEGTVEAIYAGQSTQWTRRTTICFAGGQKLTKYILTPFNPLYPTRTMLAFPNDVLFGPEPSET